MKKLLNLIICTAFVFSVLLCISAPAFALDNNDSMMEVLKYVVLDDGTAEISYYDSLNTHFSIPEAVDGYTVTSIGKKAFKGCHVLKSVTIPDTVTAINNQAFDQCQALKTVSVGKNVKTIGYKAFSECKALTTINIPDGVTTIGNNAFIKCFNLGSITIPSSVESIGNYAFSDCINLSNVTIGNGKVSIGEFAFGWCLSLKSLTLDSNLSSISCNAFVACDSLESITIKSKDCAIYNDAGTLPDCAVIYGYYGSTAHSYAETYNRKFVMLDEITDYIKGDTDGDKKVTVMDATDIQRANASYITFTATQEKAADVDDDQKVTIMDATKIQRYIAQDIKEL